MESHTLSRQAMDVIKNFLHLPFEDKNVVCPYFNNRRHGVRGALRVLVGKGSPVEIVDEALLFSLRDKVDLKKLSNEELKKFLVDHNLGIDCSGLAYYILDAECLSKKKGTLKKFLFYPTKNPFRKLLVLLRSAENTGVTTLAHERNSTEVSISDVQPGDFVVILNSGRDQTFQHVLLIHEVQVEDRKPKNLLYTHSLDWRADGKYGHGVKQGKIEIIDENKPILEQKWIEAKKTGEENDTFMKAQGAQRVEIRRLKC